MTVIARTNKTKSDYFDAVLFIGPTILLILLVTFVPIVLAISTSFHSTTFAVVGKYVGTANYKAIFGDKTGWLNILNSIEYVLMSLVLVMPIGVGIGTLLNRKIRGIGILRTLIIIPWVISQTVTAMLWKWILNGNYGPISYWFYQLTGQKSDFFSAAWSAKLMLVIANVWNSVPVVIILTLAALQTIDGEIIEAANIDGANSWQIYTKIKLPLIKPTLLTALVLQSMEYFNMVTLIFILTAGGPLGATQTLSVAAFQNAFTFWHMDYAATYSVAIFLLNIIFSLVYIKIINPSKD